MRFCSFSYQSQVRFGVETADQKIVDIVRAGQSLVNTGRLPTSVSGLFDCPDLKAWFQSGSEALEVALSIQAELQRSCENVKGVYTRREVRLVAPIQKPGKIAAIGLNYKDHAAEQNVPLPERPLIFAKFPTSVIGPDEPIKLPSISQKVDPEAELCVVILERCRNVGRTEAEKAAAFMIGNDVSARDLQYSDKQWVRGKSCDTFAPTGPFIVTRDEVGDPHSLDIQLTRNGIIQQASNTRELIFDSYFLIEYISQCITLEPGDIIFSGTPSGVGVFRDPPVFLQPGDVIEVTIEKLGTLRNPVVAN